MYTWYILILKYQHHSHINYSGATSVTANEAKPKPNFTCEKCKKQLNGNVQTFLFYVGFIAVN